MGTPEIAVPSLRALHENSKYEVALVITQPDKPKGRGNVMQAPPVKEYATSVGLEVYQPEKVRGNDEFLQKVSEIAPDFYAVVAYGKILPQNVLDVPKFAPVNVHFSLLPKYRGAAPVNWAIINGEDKTGVATMFMDAGMDTGDILLVQDTPIEKKTSVDLASELSISGADLLIETLDTFNNITPQKQDDSLATPAPIIKKHDGLIDWNMNAVDIERRVRGFQPWPVMHTSVNGKLLKIFEANVVGSENYSEVGIVKDIQKNSFLVTTSAGLLEVLDLQLEGKKRMLATDFVKGATISIGTKLG